MELIKLLAVFAVIVIVLRMKMPLFAAMVAGTISAALLFGMSLGNFALALANSAVSWSTLSTLLLFYLIAFLQRMLEKRGSLQLAQQSLDKLFNNRRVTASLAPFFLGLLPSASVVLLCGDIVERTVGEDLPNEDKAFITSFYRHIPESFLPTFSSVMIAINLTQGAVSTSSFILGMVPMVIVLAALGYLFYLRRIPKGLMGQAGDSKRSDLLGLIRGIWPIGLIIALILAFNLPVYLAAAISIAVFAITSKFALSELAPLFISAIEKNLLIGTFFVMLFKDVLGATGIIAQLPAIFSAFPIPDFLIFAMIFFLGTVISGAQAIAAIGIPLAFLSIPNAGLPLFILLMGMAFSANQLTPTHVCLPAAAEYFHINFGALVKKSLPLVLSYVVVLFGYYFLLTVLH